MTDKIFRLSRKAAQAYFAEPIHKNYNGWDRTPAGSDPFPNPNLSVSAKIKPYRYTSGIMTEPASLLDPTQPNTPELIRSINRIEGLEVRAVEDKVVGRKDDKAALVDLLLGKKKTLEDKIADKAAGKKPDGVGLLGKIGANGEATAAQLAQIQQLLGASTQKMEEINDAIRDVGRLLAQKNAADLRAALDSVPPYSASNTIVAVLASKHGLGAVSRAAEVLKVFQDALPPGRKLAGDSKPTIGQILAVYDTVVSQSAASSSQPAP